MKIGSVVHRVESCTSSNDLARELASQEAEEGTVVVAEEQTEGRGTKGRAWFSPREKGLYLSIILRPKTKTAGISLLPLVGGIAVREAILKASGLEVGLLWPNDLVWKGKKLGGILCEGSIVGNRMSYLILGVGLNISHSRDDFPLEIRTTSTSLELAAGEAVDRDSLLRNLLRALEERYRLFCRGETPGIIRSYEKSLVFSKGQEVGIVRGGERISGVFRGIDPQGGLLLEVRREVISVYSAEIDRLEFQRGVDTCC